MLDLIEKIAENLQKDPTNRQIYKDLCSVARELLKTDEKSGVKWLKWLAERCEEMVSKTFARDLGMAREFVSLHKQVFLATAPYDFVLSVLGVQPRAGQEILSTPPKVSAGARGRFAGLV